MVLKIVNGKGVTSRGRRQVRTLQPERFREVAQWIEVGGCRRHGGGVATGRGRARQEADAVHTRIGRGAEDTRV